MATNTSDAIDDGETNFFDLPQEVRDLIYLRHPGVAWIDITLAPAQVQQPVTSKVCKRMRDESLDVFYGRNTFLLDLRGWKHDDLPKSWTPPTIFKQWIESIGDKNVAKLRSLSFYSHNFKAHVKIHPDKSQQLTLKFGFLQKAHETADGAPPGYSMQLAAKRAEIGLRKFLDEIQDSKKGQPLGVRDVTRICDMIASLQPFLCKRMLLGYQGAVLPSGDVRDWPDTTAHASKCDDCGYHKINRGAD